MRLSVRIFCCALPRVQNHDDGDVIPRHQQQEEDPREGRNYGNRCQRHVVPCGADRPRKDIPHGHTDLDVADVTVRVHSLAHIGTRAYIFQRERLVPFFAGRADLHRIAGNFLHVLLGYHHIAGLRHGVRDYGRRSTASMTSGPNVSYAVSPNAFFA